MIDTETDARIERLIQSGVADNFASAARIGIALLASLTDPDTRALSLAVRSIALQTRVARPTLAT